MTDIERIELAVRRTLDRKTSSDPAPWFEALAQELAKQVKSKAECTKSST